MHHSYTHSGAGYRRLLASILTKLDELRSAGYVFEYASGKPLNAGYLSDQDFYGFLLDLKGRETGPGRYISTEKFATLDLYLRATDQEYFSKTEEVKRQQSATAHLFGNKLYETGAQLPQAVLEKRIFLPDCMTMAHTRTLSNKFCGKIPVFVVSRVEGVAHYDARKYYIAIDDSFLVQRGRAEWGLQKSGHLRDYRDRELLELTGVITPVGSDTEDGTGYLCVLKSADFKVISSTDVTFFDGDHIIPGHKTLTENSNSGAFTQFASLEKFDKINELCKILGFTNLFVNYLERAHII